MPKILVTGGAGFIGSHVVDLFVHQSGIYNIEWSRPTSINEVYPALAKITGYSQVVAYGPAKIGETRHIYLNDSKANRDLGWSPTTTLDDGLSETVEYFRTSEKAI